ncbi:hypothetical protein BJY59DRAFT_518637 [Rhodotorula toruloides]
MGSLRSFDPRFLPPVPPTSPHPVTHWAAAQDYTSAAQLASANPYPLDSGPQEAQPPEKLGLADAPCSPAPAYSRLSRLPRASRLNAEDRANVEVTSGQQSKPCPTCKERKTITLARQPPSSGVAISRDTVHCIERRRKSLYESDQRVKVVDHLLDSALETLLLPPRPPATTCALAQLAKHDPACYPAQHRTRALPPRCPRARPPPRPLATFGDDQDDPLAALFIGVQDESPRNAACCPVHR